MSKEIEEADSYIDMLVGQATLKFNKMIDDAKSGKTATGYADLGKILDNISLETARLQGLIKALEKK